MTVGISVKDLTLFDKLAVNRSGRKQEGSDYVVTAVQ